MRQGSTPMSRYRNKHGRNKNVCRNGDSSYRHVLTPSGDVQQIERSREAHRYPGCCEP